MNARMRSISALVVALALAPGAPARAAETQAIVYTTDFGSGAVSTVAFGPPRTAVPDRAKRLTGELEGWWTVRVRVRIIYRRAPATIDVAAIGPRTSIYVEAARLLRRKR